MTGFYDGVVVGSGPNGLAAAITLARAGFSVLVLERNDTPGGGCRSDPDTHPGFVHDICAAAHPLGVSSPFFRNLPLERHGVRWIRSPAPLAHPLDGGRAAVLFPDLEKTAAELGGDGAAYRALVESIVHHWHELLEDILAPPRLPRHPLVTAKFVRHAVRSASAVARSTFRREEGRALFAGLAAHGALPLERLPSAAFALTLGAAAHTAGWPLVEGGTQRLSDALVSHLRELGGEVRCGHPVAAHEELPRSRAVLFDVTPRQLMAIGGRRLPGGYRRALRRYRHGPGVFKMDWTLDGPIPWQNEHCATAATVHLGGTLEEIEASERAVWHGRGVQDPYVIVVQASRFDPTRAPEGRHTAWAYCHVPHGSRADVSRRVEAQMERFAPGFRARVRDRKVMDPRAMEEHNPNYVGGDITGGVQDLRQTLLRPVPARHPYDIPVPGWFLCSSSTPPGGGVHGMCGHHAARRALHFLRGER